MRVFEPLKIKKYEEPPFKTGDRVKHELFGLGFIRDVSRTGGGNWSLYVEFDKPHPRMGTRVASNRFASIVPSYLERVDDPYEGVDVEFGTNILDLDEAIAGE